MNLIKIDWHPSPATLRKFGIAMPILCLIAAVPLRAHLGIAISIFAFGLVTCVLCLAAPKAAMPIYWFWMLVSMLLGTLISPVVFALFYYLLITPMALLMRLVNRDKLRLKPYQCDTYWHDAPQTPAPERYERQF